MVCYVHMEDYQKTRLLLITLKNVWAVDFIDDEAAPTCPRRLRPPRLNTSMALPTSTTSASRVCLAIHRRLLRRLGYSSNKNQSTATSTPRLRSATRRQLFNYSVAHRRLLLVRPMFTSHRLVLCVPTDGVLRLNFQYGQCLLVID